MPQLSTFATGATTFGRDTASTRGPSGSSQLPGRGLGLRTVGREDAPEGAHRGPPPERTTTGRISSAVSSAGSPLGLGYRGAAVRGHGGRRPEPGRELEVSGANVFCVFATPKFSIQAIVYANRLGWRLQVIMNSVLGATTIMLLASESGKSKTSLGTLSSTTSRTQRSALEDDPGMKLYRAIMARDAKGADVNDVYHVYGMAVAYETVGLFERLGAKVTRAGLMAAARSMNDASNPFLLPGSSSRPAATVPDRVGTTPALGEAGRWVPSAGSSPRRSTEPARLEVDGTVSTSTATPGFAVPALRAALPRHGSRSRRGRSGPSPFSSRRTAPTVTSGFSPGRTTAADASSSASEHAACSPCGACRAVGHVLSDDRTALARAHRRLRLGVPVDQK